MLSLEAKFESELVRGALSSLVFFDILFKFSVTSIVTVVVVGSLHIVGGVLVLAGKRKIWNLQIF